MTLKNKAFENKKKELKEKIMTDGYTSDVGDTWLEYDNLMKEAFTNNTNIEMLDKALEEADQLMKESNGHYYVQIMKTRCQFCGKSPKDSRRCGQWFQTFITRLKEVYLNQGQNEQQ